MKVEASSTRLCTICIRGGSKGVKGKNVRLLAGKPLFVHSVEQARATGLFDAVCVSSDSEEILDLARQFGVDHAVRRPDELATDTAAKLPVIRHCVETVEKERATQYDVLVDLDATSPLRLPGDIAAVVEMLRQDGVDTVITGAPSRRSPYFTMVEVGADGGVRLSKPITPPPVRRQDAPQCYDMNAAVYGWKRAGLWSESGLFGPRSRLYVMPEERSIDIDSELDWQIVEFLFARNQIRE